MMATFLILLIGIIIGWRLSSAYHERRWLRDITRRAEGMVTGVYRLPDPRPVIHLDQEAVKQFPPPQPPLSITAICLDAHFGSRHRPRPRP